MLSDTSPEARKVRDDVLRSLSLERRAERTAARHPHYTDHDVRLAMLRMLHGDALTQAMMPGEALREF